MYRWIKCLVVMILLLETPSLLFAQRSSSRMPEALGVLPFRYDGVQMLIDITMAGHPDTLHFLFDSGAEVSILSRSIAKKFGLEDKREAGVSGYAKGMTEVPVVQVRYMQAGGVKVPFLRFYLEDLSDNRVEGIRVDGIIGYDLLKRYIVKIDYSRKVLSLYRSSASFHYPPGGTLIKFRMNYNTPIISAALTPNNGAALTGTYHITTGGDYGLLLNYPYVEKFHLASRITVTGQKVVKDLLKSITYTNGLVAAFEVGGVSFKNVKTSFSPDVNDGSATEEIAGSIGNDVWKHFTLIFNYGRREVYLLPGKS